MEKLGFCIKSEKKEIPKSISQIKNYCEQLSINNNKLLEIELCAQEAITNAIIHGNNSIKEKEVNISVFFKESFLYIIVKDEKVNPLLKISSKSFKDLKDEELLNESGRGILLMKHFCDELKLGDDGIELIFKVE